MTLLNKINEARKDFLEGYKEQSNLTTNILNEKGRWIHTHQKEFTEITKKILKNYPSKTGMYFYFAIHLSKGPKYTFYMLDYISQHPNSFNSKNNHQNP